MFVSSKGGIFQITILEYIEYQRSLVEYYLWFRQFTCVVLRCFSFERGPILKTLLLLRNGETQQEPWRFSHSSPCRPPILGTPKSPHRFVLRVCTLRFIFKKFLPNNQLTVHPWKLGLPKTSPGHHHFFRLSFRECNLWPPGLFFELKRFNHGLLNFFHASLLTNWNVNISTLPTAPGRHFESRPWRGIQAPDAGGNLRLWQNNLEFPWFQEIPTGPTERTP